MADLSKLIDLSLLQSFGELTIVPIKGAIVTLAGALEAMADAEIASSSGAHGFRYYQGELQYSTELYTAVTPAGNENPSEEGWYVLISGEYFLTEDTSVVSGKTYYEKGISWNTIATGGGGGSDVSARLGICEQNVLALYIGLELDEAIDIADGGGNIVVEDFMDTSGYTVSRGTYDSTNHRVYA